MAGAEFGLFGCTTCFCSTWPGGSQTVTIRSTVSITSTVVVTVISCLFSKGIGEDQAKKALKARVVDSFIARSEGGLDIKQCVMNDQRVMSVTNRLAIGVFGWSFQVGYWSFCTSQSRGGKKEGRKVNAGSGKE